MSLYQPVPQTPGICQRCGMRRSLLALVSDPNAPGLRVCQDGCVDQFDPYRLPARRPENITLRYPRPDVALTASDDGADTDDARVLMSGSVRVLMDCSVRVTGI